MTTSAQIIDLLQLEPHPEGGWYRQTFADDRGGERPVSTVIYYLLEAGVVSAWHKVDALEIWHWYAGAPLDLRISEDGQNVETIALGNDLLAGQRPQGIVPLDAWQSARSQGDWTLVGCTVAPGFLFSGFEMAPKGWEPGR